MCCIEDVKNSAEMFTDEWLGAYELGQNWWNQGLMTEATKSVINFFFNEVGYNRIQSHHASENPASGKVMQKCGMNYEGTMSQACKCNNGLFDKVNYAILADDYFNSCT